MFTDQEPTFRDDCGHCSEPHGDLDLRQLAVVIGRDGVLAAVGPDDRVQFYDPSGRPISRPLTAWLVHVCLDFDGDEQLAALDYLATA